MLDELNKAYSSKDSSQVNVSYQNNDDKENEKSSNIYLVIVKLFELGIGEYEIYDVIFNIPFA